jgi:uncharacterized membrane protein
MARRLTSAAVVRDVPRALMTAPRPQLPKPIRIVRNHARLFSSVAVGMATFAFEPLLWDLSARATRFLIAWDLFVVIYLAQTIRLIARWDLALARRRAAEQDDGGLALLVLTIGAAVMSLVAIVAQLGGLSSDAARGPYFALVVVTISLSWCFVQVIFCLHYAHDYYDEDDEGGGLQFPQDDAPEYWDFLYFSVVIGMTFQVSDVQVTGKQMRRLVMAHGLVSFVFNVAILALIVNLGANLIDSGGR